MKSGKTPTPTEESEEDEDDTKAKKVERIVWTEELSSTLCQCYLSVLKFKGIF